MNKKEKMALVPKLRFPEFNTIAEWKITTLDSLAVKITMKNKDCSVTQILTNSAVYGVVDQSDYFEREIVTQSNINNYFIVDEGDYVYNPRISTSAPVGPVSKNNIGKGIMSPLYTIFRFNNPQNEFYEQYFKTNLWNSYIKNVSNTGARHDRISISAEKFMKMPLPYSTDEKEQRKIADCISSLDKLISAENEKLLTLKDHKKALMQKLFPSEGKRLPEWRFPEFGNSNEWEVKKLVNVGEIVTGNTPSTNVEEYYNGDYLFVSPADISDKRYVLSTRTTLSKVGFEQTRPIKENSILFVCIGSTIGKIAQNKKECATNQQINSIIPYDSYFNSYIYYALDCIRNTVILLAGKQAVPIINKTLFSNVKIPIPTNKQEQKKIADCLSELDNLILAQSDNIESLKQHKMSLMQGLFLSLEEVGE